MTHNTVDVEAAIEVVRRARDTLTHEGWCQGAWYRAGHYCLAGALQMHLRQIVVEQELDLHPVFTCAVGAVNEAIGRDNYVLWNDDDGRTVGDVLAALDRAELALKEQLLEGTDAHAR